MSRATGVFDNADGPVAELRERQREAVLNPVPGEDETHRLTGLSQVSYRASFESDPSRTASKRPVGSRSRR